MSIRVFSRGAVTSLILGRVVYAINWFNLAAVFSLVASDLDQNVTGLGFITAVFYIGIGIFQLPGGFLAAKIGPRLTTICGTTIASMASLLTGFVDSQAEMLTLRFLVGMGMALVFSPGVVLITRYLHEGSEGFGVGLYNSASYLGGFIGLFGWAFLAGVVGWRNSLLASGLLGLFTSLLLFFYVPKDVRRSNFRVEFVRLKSILVDKWLIAISVALLGLGIGTTIVGNFMAYYVENVIHVDVGQGGIIASLTPLFALVTAPLSGRMFDRHGKPKQLLLVSGLLMTLGVGLVSWNTVYSAILSGILVGSASGAGLTFAFSAARAGNRFDPGYETLIVSWVNSIALFGSFVLPLLFSYLVTQFGYPSAWLLLAMLAFALMIPVFLTEGSS